MTALSLTIFSGNHVLVFIAVAFWYHIKTTRNVWTSILESGNYISWPLLIIIHEDKFYWLTHMACAHHYIKISTLVFINHFARKKFWRCRYYNSYLKLFCGKILNRSNLHVINQRSGRWWTKECLNFSEVLIMTKLVCIMIIPLSRASWTIIYTAKFQCTSKNLSWY